MSYTAWELDGLYVLRWGAQPEVADVLAYAKEIALARERQNKQLVALFIMPSDSAAPNEAFRKVQAGILQSLMSNLEFAIAVFEGTGFAASLKRNALVAILLLNTKHYPIYVRATIEEALVLKPPRTMPFDASKALAELRQRGGGRTTSLMAQRST